ncbi:MAG: maleate cis-trans isomerase [Rhodobacteraceae bacterium]|nr:maleate cis-trans isomerase [Paracoccaceae bacterium]
MTDVLNLGLVYPGGGPESDIYSFERVMAGRLRVFLSNSEFGIVDGSDHHPDALRMTAEVPRIASAAERLNDCNLDALVWACTSGSFVNGRAFAEDQAAQLSNRLGIPVTSTSLAFAAALKELSVRRVALLSTYPESATDLFVIFLSEFGTTVTARHFIGNPSGWQSAVMQCEDIRDAASDLDLTQCQALLIPDTALPSLSWAPILEQRIGRPVLTANSVSLWHGLRIMKGQSVQPNLEFGLTSLEVS